VRTSLPTAWSHCGGRCSLRRAGTLRRALNNICPARDSPHPDRLRSRRSTHKPSATPSSALPDRARQSRYAAPPRGRSLIERRYSVPSQSVRRLAFRFPVGDSFRCRILRRCEGGFGLLPARGCSASRGCGRSRPPAS
jgi:hypothetical protein